MQYDPRNRPSPDRRRIAARQIQAQRRAAARRRRNLLRAAGVIFILICIIGIVLLCRSCSVQDSYTRIAPSATAAQDSPESVIADYPAFAGDGGDISSRCVLLVNLTEGRVVCEKNSTEQVKIASLTKIMTATVALENIKDLDEKYTMDSDIIDCLTRENSAVAGFAAGESVSARDLLYAAMLPSGGDGAMGLADLVGGLAGGLCSYDERQGEGAGHEPHAVRQRHRL